MTLLRWYTSNTAAAPAQSCYDIQNDTETLQLLEHNIPLRVGPRRSPGFVVVPVLLVGSRVIVARPFSLFSTALHISLVKWIHAHGNGSKRGSFLSGNTAMGFISLKPERVRPGRSDAKLHNHIFFGFFCCFFARDVAIAQIVLQVAAALFAHARAHLCHDF